MSTRPVTPEMVTAFAQGQIRPVLFIELDFASGFLRCATSGHDLDWNGHTWLGVGLIGAVSPIRESTSLQALGVECTVSGCDPALITIALTENYRRRPARIWLAAVDKDTGAIVNSPAQIFGGLMDTMVPTLTQTASIALQIESEFASWSNARVLRFTDADQRKLYPSDGSFRFITEAASRTIRWGRT